MKGGYRSAVHARESDDDILGVVRHDLEEVSLVDDLMDHLVHVVRDVGVGRDDDVQRIARAVGRVRGLSPRGVVLSQTRNTHGAAFPASVLAQSLGGFPRWWEIGVPCWRAGGSRRGCACHAARRRRSPRPGAPRPTWRCASSHRPAPPASPSRPPPAVAQPAPLQPTTRDEGRLVGCGGGRTSWTTFGPVTKR